MVKRVSRPAFTLIELLTVLAIITVLIGLLIPAVMRGRDAAARADCASRLRQLGIALHQSHDTNRALPPGASYRDGRDPLPFMSWHTRLLPYLEQEAMWKRALADFATGKPFYKTPPHVGLVTPMRSFSCPSDERTRTAGPFAAFTSFLGVSGIEVGDGAGLLFLDSAVRFGDITDGLSNTLMVGERPPSATGILGWWYGGQGQGKTGSADMVLGVRETNLFSEPSVSNCPEGPYEFGPGQLKNNCDVFHFWSPHIGGGHFLFADGSTRFLSYSAKSVLPALATRSGGEVVDIP